MYPNLTQFDTRRTQTERELQVIRELRRVKEARKSEPRARRPLVVWAGAFARPR
jgi:hypothetical protein